VQAESTLGKNTLPHRWNLLTVSSHGRMGEEVSSSIVYEGTKTLIMSPRVPPLLFFYLFVS
jgi:hypothetical protein